MNKKKHEALLFREDINGLRALAVVAVILYHFSEEIIPLGYLGVDIFFVISGYLIASIIKVEIANNTYSISEFLVRRVKRLVPALALMLSLSLLISFFMLPIADLEETKDSAISASLFLSNFFFWIESDYFHTDTELMPFIHTWTLGVEAQFYLFASILFLFLFKSRFYSLVLLIIAAVSLFLFVYFAAHESSFYLLPARFWEFLAGVGVALMITRNTSSRIVNESISMVSLILLLITVGGLGYLGEIDRELTTVIVVVATAFLISSCQNETFVRRLLSASLLAGIGTISYSLYLWHQPLIVFSKIIDPASEYTSLIFIIALLIPISFASYKFIETPLRRITLKSARWLILLVLLLFSLIGSHIFSERLDPERSFTYLFKNNILILGDSSSDEIYRVLDSPKYSELGEVRRIGISVHCQMAIYIENEIGDKYKCGESAQKIINSPLLKSADEIIVSNNWWGRPQISHYKKIIASIRLINEDAAIKIVICRPNFPDRVPFLLDKVEVKAGKYIRARENWYGWYENSKLGFSSVEGVEVVDFCSFLKTEEEKFLISNLTGDAFFYDAFHFSNVGLTYYESFIVDALFDLDD